MKQVTNIEDMKWLIDKLNNDYENIDEHFKKQGLKVPDGYKKGFADAASMVQDYLVDWIMVD